MQRQKTIAKWLAIILLLTAIVACYVAFSAILNDKTPQNPDIAGADSDTTPPKEEDPAPPPVYTSFPRAHETVDGMIIRHVGGEGNDIFLESVYFGGKRFVFFYSASTQYDVKDCGIHIAAFSDSGLQSVTQVSSANESFVCAGVVQNGMLVVTKDAAHTKLRLYDSACRLLGENLCDVYTSYKLYVTSASVRLFATDTRYIYALTITNSLDVIRSNFVYPLDGCDVVYTASTGDSDILFVQSPQGIGALTFSSTLGFSYKYELLNCLLLQILPVASNGKPSFALLAKCDSGVKVISVNEALAETASYTFKGAQSACAATSENGNIKILAGGAQAVFCSHLELQSSQSLKYDEAITAMMSDADDNISVTAIDGEKELFVISVGNMRNLARLVDDKFTTLFQFNGKNIKTVREQTVNGISRLSVIFDGSAVNDFGYMCFGANDVFYVTLP